MALAYGTNGAIPFTKTGVGIPAWGKKPIDRTRNRWPEEIL
jgi:hypothetical protein